VNHVWEEVVLVLGRVLQVIMVLGVSPLFHVVVDGMIIGMYLPLFPRRRG
jgi:hypothetical protein